MASKHSDSFAAEPGRISRREFARRAALGAAVAAAAASELILPVALASPSPRPMPPVAEEPKLSPEARAEGEEKISAILRKYGTRLSEEQKTEIRRMVMEGQAPLETLRAYPLENSDEPATVLRPAREAAAAKSSKPARKSPSTGSKPPAAKKGA